MNWIYLMACFNTGKTAHTAMKGCLLFSFLCVLLLCIFYEFGWSVTLRVNPLAFSSSSSRNVTILLWHYPFDNWMKVKGNVCWDLYRIPHCHLVDQRSMFPSADVVVFHNVKLKNRIEKLPIDWPRPQGQRWAWWSREAHHLNGDLRPYANIFNMTISFRKDADVTVPYGELLPKEDGEGLMEDNLQQKTTLICWVVHNFRNRYKRTQVYNELNAIVPVKVYGPLASKDLLPTLSHCYFYLAFENTLSKDYITGELWRNSFQSGAVPVVLGAPLSDYKAVAPPHSFIHVDEFASVGELAKYLQELAKDKKRYAEYLSWKQHWKVKRYENYREGLCKICPQFNSLPQRKVYSDLVAWDKAENTSA